MSEPIPLAELRQQAIEIWQAGVDAVGSDRLVREHVRISEGRLHVADQSWLLSDLGRVVVVGAGKAGAGMASAVEDVLLSVLPAERVTGHVNVPADCVRELRQIRLHAARPAGVNEPVQAGVDGTREILKLVRSLQDNDLAICLLSGGGSALLPAPVDGISLADKQCVTRLLMHGGATIGELNTVRKQLSQIKGGGLGRSLTHGRLVSLIISDVIGDPLDVIASGPTVDDSATPADALAVLARIVPDTGRIPPTVIQYLEQRRDRGDQRPAIDPQRVSNHIIGCNRVALMASAARADALGYRVIDQGSNNTGIASEVGRDLARLCIDIRCRSESSPVCVLSGGEPVVRLAETTRQRKGGRNQELVVAAADELLKTDTTSETTGAGIVVLSGGTDGEDGPTDAAGGFVDAGILSAIRIQQLDPADSLAINDSWTLLNAVSGLLKTGPTHTNVMDLRVALIDPRQCRLSAQS